MRKISTRKSCVETAAPLFTLATGWSATTLLATNHHINVIFGDAGTRSSSQAGLTRLWATRACQ